MENSQQHIGHNHTSAFTMPTPTRKQLKQRQRQRQKQQQQEQQKQQKQGEQEQRQQHEEDTAAQAGTSATPASPLHFPDSNKDIASPTCESGRSPSLPWLVEYWSSSLMRAPAVVIDRMMCSCASTSVRFQDGDGSCHSNSIVKNHSYFDETIVKSDPANVVRSPTKISPTRWEALRAVVASHGDYTMQDYCDIYESTVPTNDDGKQFLSKTGQMDLDEPTSIEFTYSPIKTAPTDWSKYRESSILAADDSMEEDEDFDVADDDDDIRMEPPTSPSLRGEDDPDASGRDLYTCNSFDQYIDTTSRYLCVQQEQERQRVPATPPPPTPPRAPPANRLPDRRRSRQAAAATNLTPRALGFQRMQPHSPSTDTYTTISLSLSFAREFDDDDDSSEHMVERRSPNPSSSAPVTPTAMFRQKREKNAVSGLFLDRIATETMPDSQSPFRRLQPRTRASNIVDEKKEESVEYPSTPPRKRSSEENADEDESDYRCLVRMSPDNYRHEKHSSYDDWYTPEESRAVSVASSASSSVLLPLHPHQRIIDPLPHLDSLDGDHSGYTCFRHKFEKQRQEQQLHRVSTPVECS